MGMDELAVDPGLGVATGNFLLLHDTLDIIAPKVEEETEVEE